MEHGNNLKPIYRNINKDLLNKKQKQLELILKTNPAFNDTSTWVRTIEDIKTLEEAFDDRDWKEYKLRENPLFANAMKTRKMKVYGSKPIVNGNWITPDIEEARSYAGKGKVYESEIDIDDVAWIDPYQGQYAKIK